MQFVDLLLQPLQFRRDVCGHLARRGQFGYGCLSRNLQEGIRPLEEFGTGSGPKGRDAQRNQKQQPGQTPWLSDDKATTQLTHGVIPLKCVLRLIRSDLAAPGVVPPDDRGGYKTVRQYNRHIRHNP